MAEFLIIGILAAYSGWVIRKKIKNIRAGNCGCGGGSCGSCPGCNLKK